MTKMSESSSSDDDSTYGSADGEMLLDEPGPPSPGGPHRTARRIMSFCTNLDWKNLGTSLCLWIAFFLCNTCYSSIAPFFPSVVSSRIYTRTDLYLIPELMYNIPHYCIAVQWILEMWTPLGSIESVLIREVS